jgi:hypothetical protein
MQIRKYGCACAKMVHDIEMDPAHSVRSFTEYYRCQIAHLSVIMHFVQDCGDNGLGGFRSEHAGSLAVPNEDLLGVRYCGM